MEQLPTRYVLHAAAHVVRIIGHTKPTRTDLDDSYRNLASGGIFPFESLRTGERLLADLGFLKNKDGRFLCDLAANVTALQLEELTRQLGRLILLEQMPLWLKSAISQGEVRRELIPVEAADRLADIFPDVAEREALLLAAARRHDASIQEIIGDAGERLVEAKCKNWLLSVGRADLASRVNRVSQVSDELGYDVSAPDLLGNAHQMEVKSFTGDQVRFFLSRNEYIVGKQYPSWSLVFCQVPRNRPPVLLGWCELSLIEERLPKDVDARSKWTAAQVIITLDELCDGLPIMAKKLPQPGN